MYTFKISGDFLSKQEMAVFDKYLEYYRLDRNVWEVFACLFGSKVRNTVPMVVRVFDDSGLCGAVILVKCSGFGKALFDNRFKAGIMDISGMSFYFWIKYGCCMDMMSNPGFVADPEKADEIHAAVADFLKKRYLITMIYDYSEKSFLYPGSSCLPAPPHAIIDTADMTGVQDYIKEHKYIKHKMNSFKNNGGAFEIVENVLDADTIASLRRCFVSTSQKSLFYLPYQDLYLSSALKTSSTRLENVFYFIAKINGVFLGYQAAIKTGSCLNALHGAFDRERKTTFHAYDILFVKMVEFALENGLKSIDFGSVINITKQRMINRQLDLTYYYFSKYPLFLSALTKLLKTTKIQSEAQMQFIPAVLNTRKNECGRFDV